MGILRTFLAIAVVVYHSFTIFGFRLCGGQLAVEAFFMISGFYMALILNEKYTGKGYYKKFITGRFYRIFPVYWIVLLLAFILSIAGYYWFNNPFYLTRYINNYEKLSLTTILFFVFENSVIIGQDILYFLSIDAWYHPRFDYFALSYKHSANQYLLVPQAWSISLELLFYCLAPFIVKRKIKWQIIIIVLSFLVKIIFATFYNLSIDPWTYRFFPFELGFFISGSLAYQWYQKLKQMPTNSLIGKTLLVVCIFAIVFVSEISFHHQALKQLLFYGLIFISIPYLFLSFKNNKLDRYIGELSFSIYISHLLIVSMLHPLFFHQTFPMKYYGMATLFCSLILAVIFNQWIIQPIEKWRTRKMAGQ